MRLVEPLLTAALIATPGWTQVDLTSALSTDDVAGNVSLTTGDRGGLAATTYEPCSTTFAVLRAASPPPTALVKQTLVAGPEASGTGYVAVLDRRECGGKSIDLVELDADGAVRNRTPLPVRGAVELLVLEPGADGSLAVVWSERSRLRAITRTTEGRLGRPVTLTHHRSADFTAATSDAGEVVVAWADERVVRTATVTRTGRVGARARLGRSLGITALSIALRGERALVAWDTWSSADVHARLYAAVRDGRRFRAAELVDRAPQIDQGFEGDTPALSPSVALSDDGHALVAWHRFRQYHYEPRLAAAQPGQGFAEPRTPKDTHEVGDVAFDPGGGPIVALLTSTGVVVERDGARETVATERDAFSLSLDVLEGGRLQASWLTGWGIDAEEESSIKEPSVLSVATSDT
ncbi:hypothetical protein OJ997_33765 [Solirubrobacter phytolaccae]|uniref:Uncharacterized protein n=1 Tax=Solirubrobacter phytolaccae TaxID=1404360 RepID=A0A9X3NPX3_9ACTN|nr:hypothetical protein [Solirubrobacter phytolaccae]MDA0185322.1 hypothetical protein [Solirubrobacter phytolaccae]